MTIYNIDINKIFKTLRELPIDCKYINITVDAKTNSVKINGVIPTENLKLIDNSSPTEKDDSLSELI